MRLRHADGTVVHLSYGTNVHPAETLDGVLAQLDTYAEPVRRLLGWDRLGLGLWLSADVAAGLAADPAAVRRLAAELSARGLEVVTLNAFPYQGFHDEVVKHAVYRPSWVEPARARYTLDCATVLAGLLPADAQGGTLSTLPLGWRTPWSAADDDTATRALTAVSEGLRRLPRPVRLAVESEPGCVLDEVADAVRWLAGRVDPDLVGLCLDTCHLAVSFADPAATVRSVVAAGLAVHKVQASVALQARGGHSSELAAFAEPRYLHQTRAGQSRADDLSDAFERLPATEPWRVHFHVPLHWENTSGGPLEPTTDVLAESAVALFGGPYALSSQVEVETYTWGVLPPGRRPADDTGLVAGIAAELSTAYDLLLHSGLSKGEPA